MEDDWDSEPSEAVPTTTVALGTVPPDPKLPEASEFSRDPSHRHLMNLTGTQARLKLHRQWEEEMERLYNKYGLDCFSDSELDSESDEGKEYRYEHNYKTLL